MTKPSSEARGAAALTPEDTCGAGVILDRLYRRVWQLCAGWNRVPFRGKQVRHICRTFDVELEFAALGNVEGIAILSGSDRRIVLNRKLSLRAVESTSGEHGVEELLTHRGRLVFFHELAHLFLHAEEPYVWRTESVAAFCSMRLGGYCQWDPQLLYRIGSDRLAAAVKREVEADFFSVVALVPDYVVWRLVRDERDEVRILREIVGYLGANEVRAIKVGADAGDLGGLAQYRLDTFRTFAHIFRAVSAEIENGTAGKDYRAVATIDGVDAESVRKVNGAREHEHVSQIMTRHPLVRSNTKVREAVSGVNAVPFDSLRERDIDQRCVDSSATSNQAGT